jgi:hypothetical protein
MLILTGLRRVSSGRPRIVARRGKKKTKRNRERARGGPRLHVRRGPVAMQVHAQEASSSRGLFARGRTGKEAGAAGRAYQWAAMVDGGAPAGGGGSRQPWGASGSISSCSSGLSRRTSRRLHLRCFYSDGGRRRWFPGVLDKKTAFLGRAEEGECDGAKREGEGCRGWARSSALLSDDHGHGCLPR